MESRMTIDVFGTREWYFNGKLHRKDGPAIEGVDGTKEWYVNGVRHREDGPAIELANGYKWWYLNGKLHREDGPAVEQANGTKSWYVNGVRHREDGPAVEWANGTKEWHIYYKLYTKKTYFIKIKDLILEKIGTEIANMFGFDQDNAWENSDTFILADYIEEQGDSKTANQIRNLIKFASC